MSFVDEILASGRYMDRRGRGWDYVETVASWCSPEIDAEGVSWGYRYLDTAQMRLLIEREQHRDECPGLWTCEDHPVPAVTLSRMFRPRVFVNGEPYAWFSEAIDAARALAVRDV